jgi:DNA-directed RNA polymerase specialized sigma24 family protein
MKDLYSNKQPTRWQKLSKSYNNKPVRHLQSYNVEHTLYGSLLQHLSPDDITDLYNNDLGFDDPFDSTPDKTFSLNDLADTIQQLQPPHYSLVLIMLVSGYSRNDIVKKLRITHHTLDSVIKKARAKLFQIVDKRYKIRKYRKHKWEILTPPDDYTA